MKSFKYVAVCLALFASAVYAGTFTFSTPAGAKDAANEPVSAEAIFVTSGNTLSITLENLQANPTSAGQLLSDLFFTLNNVTSGLNETSSSGGERTVLFGGTFTDGSTVASGWGFSVTNGVFHLDDLNNGAAPTHTIIGPPGPGNLYSNANPSITGSAMHTPGTHSPFLHGDVTFNFTGVGINSDTIVTSATFSFGTASGDNVPGNPGPTPPPSTPDGGSTLMLLGAALGLAEVVRKAVFRSAVTIRIRG